MGVSLNMGGAYGPYEGIEITKEFGIIRGLSLRSFEFFLCLEDNGLLQSPWEVRGMGEIVVNIMVASKGFE